jgi:hypothetical protein
MQEFIAYGLGIVALLYIIKKIIGQFRKKETDSNCTKCEPKNHNLEL